jgi:DNA-directed RNA polymerase specialized sigma24 family protein
MKMKATMAKPAPVHYVDNKVLFDVLTTHLDSVKQYKLNPIGEQPRTPEYIGECLLKIARRLSNKPNFANYSFRDDMISDAVENSLLYMHNFDPAKSKNPFAYFTQIIHFAFLRRIEREKRHVYVKYKYAMRQSLIGADHFNSEDSETGDLRAPAWLNYENVTDFVRDYEAKLAKPKKSKNAPPSLDLEDEKLDLDDIDDIIDPDSLGDLIPTEANSSEDE